MLLVYREDVVYKLLRAAGIDSRLSLFFSFDNRRRSCEWSSVRFIMVFFPLITLFEFLVLGLNASDPVGLIGIPPPLLDTVVDVLD